jgi:Skp family chaperone for outer membrane proteins
MGILGWITGEEQRKHQLEIKKLDTEKSRIEAEVKRAESKVKEVEQEASRERARAERARAEAEKATAETQIQLAVAANGIVNAYSQTLQSRYKHERDQYQLFISHKSNTIRNYSVIALFLIVGGMVCLSDLVDSKKAHVNTDIVGILMLLVAGWMIKKASQESDTKALAPPTLDDADFRRNIQRIANGQFFKQLPQESLDAINSRRNGGIIEEVEDGAVVLRANHKR